MIVFLVLPVLASLVLGVRAGRNLVRQIRAGQIIRVRDCLFFGVALAACAFAVSLVTVVLAGLGHSACAGAQAEIGSLLVFVIGVACPMAALFLYRYYQTLVIGGGRVRDDKPDLTRLHDATTVTILLLAAIVVLLLAKLTLWPPLMFALRNGYTGMAETLIDAGLFFNESDICGSTPLSYAAMARKENLVKRMVEHGADVNATDNHDLTALSQALIRTDRNLALYLVEKGADVNPSPAKYFTPLMLAAQTGDTEFCRLLLAKGADVNAKGAHGSALACAARYDKVEVARLLLDHHADTEIPAATGWTPLMHACYEGHANMVKLLLERGANPRSKTYSQETPASVATVGGHVAIVEIIEAHVSEEKAHGDRSRKPAAGDRTNAPINK